MKIGILTNYHLNHVGGAELVIDRLARHWHEAGHEVVLFSSRGRRRENYRFWQCACRHVEIPSPWSTRFFLSRYVRYLEREHQRGPLDLIFASDTYWPGHVARLLKAESGVPYVTCSHGSDCRPGSRFLLRPVCRRRLSLAISEADGMVCISSYMSRRLHELGTPRGLVRMIHNGWPDEWADHPAPPLSVLSGPYLFSMGRIVELKGFHTLLDAFARLRGPHPRLNLVIAGDGPYLGALVRQAGRLGLAPIERLPEADDPPGSLYLPGFVHGDLKRALAHHATLGVLPSVREEPQSLVLLEMLCGGVPVVASDAGGNPDIVRPGLNGDLFSAGDSGQLTACLDRLLSDPQQLTRLSHQATVSVEPLRWSHVAQRYLELFREVVGRSSVKQSMPHRTPTQPERQPA